MSGNVFDDDRTRPATPRPPTFRPPTSIPPTPSVRTELKGPPAFDPLDIAEPDALTARSVEALSMEDSFRPLRTTRASWRPPSRPNAPSVHDLHVLNGRGREWLLVVAALAISIMAFALVVQISGGLFEEISL